MDKFHNEGLVERIVRNDEGGIHVTTTTHTGVYLPPGSVVDHIREGQPVAILGALGEVVRSVRIGDVVCFHRTQDDIDRERAAWEAKLKQDRIDQYQRNKDLWLADWKALPLPLFLRILRMVVSSGGFEERFRDDNGSYELFCCVEAAKFYRYFKQYREEHELDEEQMFKYVRDFMSMPYKKQLELVPYDNKNHSNNTFGAAIQLAFHMVMDKEV